MCRMMKIVANQDHGDVICLDQLAKLLGPDPASEEPLHVSSWSSPQELLGARAAWLLTTSRHGPPGKVYDKADAASSIFRV